MNAETLAKIISDFDFLISEDRLKSLNEVVTALNTYLFALAQHGVIDSSDYKTIGNIVLKACIKTAKEIRANKKEENE